MASGTDQQRANAGAAPAGETRAQIEDRVAARLADHHPSEARLDVTALAAEMPADPAGKRAWILDHHPDRQAAGPDRQAAEAHFKDVQEAVRIVKDDDRFAEWQQQRAEYTRALHAEVSREQAAAAARARAADARAVKRENAQQKATSQDNVAGGARRSESRVNRGNPFATSEPTWTRDEFFGSPFFDAAEGAGEYRYGADSNAAKSAQRDAAASVFAAAYGRLLQPQPVRSTRVRPLWTMKAEVSNAIDHASFLVNFNDPSLVDAYAASVLQDDGVARRAAVADLVENNEAFAALRADLADAGFRFVRPELLAETVLSRAAADRAYELQGFGRADAESVARLADHATEAGQSLTRQTLDLADFNTPVMARETISGLGI